jgi:hypothetical protein
METDQNTSAMITSESDLASPNGMESSPEPAPGMAVAAARAELSDINLLKPNPLVELREEIVQLRELLARRPTVRFGDSASTVAGDHGGMEFIFWLSKIGRSRATGYRWRNKGMINTINVEGKLYITTDEILRFWGRAAAGEFAREGLGVTKGQLRSKQ